MATKVRCTLLRSVAEADFSVNDILELNAKYLHVCVFCICAAFCGIYVYVCVCVCFCVCKLRINDEHMSYIICTKWLRVKIYRTSLLRISFESAKVFLVLLVVCCFLHFHFYYAWTKCTVKCLRLDHTR